MNKKEITLISCSGKIASGKNMVTAIIQYYARFFRTGENKEAFRATIEQLILTKQSQLLSTEFKEISWADGLKDMVCILLSCTRSQLEDREFKEKELGEEWWSWVVVQNNLTMRIPYLRATADEVCDMFGTLDIDLEKLTPRLILQRLGTGGLRDLIHQDAHSNMLLNKLKQHPYQRFIITDTRFENEDLAVIDKGGLRIRIERELMYRFPEVWKEYKTSEATCPYVDWIEKHHPDLHERINHQSEVELDYTKMDETIYNNGTILETITQVENLLFKYKIIQ